MDTLNIEILNPKAKKLLQDLADLDLIAIKGASKSDLLKKLRSKKGTNSSSENISAEVEGSRSKTEKLNAMKHAFSDPLFLNDIKEIADDFGAIDHEGI